MKPLSPQVLNAMRRTATAGQEVQPAVLRRHMRRLLQTIEVYQTALEDISEMDAPAGEIARRALGSENVT